MMDAPINNHFKTGEYSQIIDDSLQRYHPEYWQAHEKGQTMPKNKASKERDR